MPSSRGIITPAIKHKVDDAGISDSYRAKIMHGVLFLNYAERVRASRF